jgi:DNA-directed RNA polymerase alpha subunit
MDYYNNEALEVILKYEESTNKNTVTLNNNQKHTNKNLVEFINVFKGFIDELKEENKLIREDLKQIKSVFNLDKESTKDEVISSPPKEYQEMIDILNEVPNYKNGLSIRNHNCLSNANIRTNYDLVKCSKRDLLSIRNFGKHSYHEVIEYLNWNNLTIGMDVSEYEPYLNTK